MRTFVFDSECYSNYYLAAFRDAADGTCHLFENRPGSPFPNGAVKRLLKDNQIVTFNGISYDVPVLRCALAGAKNDELKAVNDAIIVGGMKWWQVEDNFDCSPFPVDHIDLIEVAPGQASLKMYGARLHSRTLQDMPIDPNLELPDNCIDSVRHYCMNDLALTTDLYNHLRPQIELRVGMQSHYGQDMRSKSDAQIAEAVIISTIEKVTKQQVYRPNLRLDLTFVYTPPGFVRFRRTELQDLLLDIMTTQFRLSDKGAVEMPEWLGKSEIAIGNGKYRLGIGGLHSSEERRVVAAGNGFRIYDRDVTSYYPSIILNLGLEPVHLKGSFLPVYRSIVDERVHAKKTGDKVRADVLKISANGTFGKLGSKWSKLFSPELLIRVTLTGQLSLLMLIEALEDAGIPVVSANTDGVTVVCHDSKRETMLQIVQLWERNTGFNTEEVEYLAVYSRDVNSYIAIKANNSGIKLKGAYSQDSLMKNPQNDICIDAVVSYLRFGIPCPDTIMGCQDIRKFITARNVTGGAMKGLDYLGKAIRWYYAKGIEGDIVYKKNGNKVPRSDGARPCMTLPDIFPEDVDYAWYERECNEILIDLGVLPLPQVPPKKRRKKEDGSVKEGSKTRPRKVRPPRLKPQGDGADGSGSLSGEEGEGAEGRDPQD